jgi:tetrahydromethanopterin S-methyltransferase subunit H
VEYLKELKVQNAVIMAFSTQKPLADGRISILEGNARQKGLLSSAEEAGIKNILIYTIVLDVPSIGVAAKAIQLVKEKFGLPAGCGPANAVTT